MQEQHERHTAKWPVSNKKQTGTCAKQVRELFVQCWLLMSEDSNTVEMHRIVEQRSFFCTRRPSVRFRRDVISTAVRLRVLAGAIYGVAANKKHKIKKERLHF